MDCTSASPIFRRHCRIIRHHIGRLDAWVRTPHTLTKSSGDYREFLLSMRLRSLGWSRPAGYFLDVKKPLRRAATLRCARTLSQQQPFRARPLSPAMVHAEMTIIHHFYTNDLESWDDEAYIGCSKRSCPTCELYGQLHPRKWTLRASHGNVWPKWAFPDSDKFSQARMDRVNIEIMRKIVAQMKHSVDFWRQKGVGPRKGFFESSTGPTGTDSNMEG